MTRSRTLVTSTVLVFCACSPQTGQDLPSTSIDRRVVPLSAELLWRRGGPVEDSVLYNPWVVRADDGMAVVLDRDGYRVRAFETATGQLIWSQGRRGEGPGEFSGPVDLFREGALWSVWDDRTSRLTRFTDEGRFAGELLVPNALLPTRFCPLNGAGLAVLLGSPTGAAGVMGTDGHIDRVTHFPWSGYDRLLPIQRQARWLTDGTGTCVAALTMASGFARFDANGFGPGHGYAEAIPHPSVEVHEAGRVVSTALEATVVAIEGGFVLGSEIWFLFVGDTEDAGRLIDIHDLESGAYKMSLRLPFDRVRSMARSGSRLFVLRVEQGYPILEAYDTAETPIPQPS